MRKRRVVGRIYGLKYSWQGHKERNRHKNGLKRSGQARLVYVKALTATFPPREGEPVGTAEPSRFHYIRWRYDAETEKERPSKPSCIVLNMTRRCHIPAFVWSWNLKKEANPSCIMLNMTERGKHYHLVRCSALLKEANTAILCKSEVGTEIQTLSYCTMTMSMTQRQTLPSRVVLTMTQRGKHCCLVWCWILPRAKFRWKYVKR